MNMEGKRVKDSILIMAQQMTPQDANLAGNVHGGVIMKLIDTAAGIVAFRHAEANVVTASIDRLDFIYPAFIGDLVTTRTSVNFVGRTSMEVGVRVETENLLTRQKHHAASAYLTMVAIDGSGKPMPLPPLIIETDEEKRRNLEAKDRREMRLKEKKKEKISRINPNGTA
jgi:uncharacterized protein (TIGR00369 family)